MSQEQKEILKQNKTQFFIIYKRVFIKENKNKLFRRCESKFNLSEEV